MIHGHRVSVTYRDAAIDARGRAFCTCGWASTPGSDGQEARRDHYGDQLTGTGLPRQQPTHEEIRP